ncbi:MAG: hypothetical protein AAFQ50_16670, partial [Pseudomonadota bacterium]
GRAAAGSVDLSGFDSDVMVFGQTGGDMPTATAHRVYDVDRSGFDYRFVAEEAAANQRPTDTLSWVAIEEDAALVTTGSLRLSEKVKSTGVLASDAIFADMQSYRGIDPATLRYDVNDAGRLTLRLTEEQSKDFERGHHWEDVAWMQVQTGVFDLL